MAFNSYKDDEVSVEKSKIQTLKRLFGYLLAYKWQILLVLVIMGYGVAVSLVNPLIMESAIDDYIGQQDLKGLYRLLCDHFDSGWTYRGCSDRDYDLEESDAGVCFPADTAAYGCGHMLY